MLSLPLHNMPTQNQKLTFSKNERLCSKIIIDEIFEKGKKVKAFPFIVTYLPINSENCEWENQAKIVIAVPKKKVKLAVNRNVLKRRIKEAYRLNKQPFYTALKEKNSHLALFLVYIGKENENFSYLEKKLKLLLTDIQDKI